MKKIYKLTPSLHANLWGGVKLRDYGKVSDADRIGESWELSFVESAPAKLDDGRTTIEAFPKSVWGTDCADFDFFPVLTKFIDAREKLSVQVHPADDYALANEGQYGKSEMWYVVDAEEGAGLYMGLNKHSTPDELARAISDGSVENMLSFKPVKRGDVFFIPAGTIHAIGAGVLIYEIQQNSTLTYRLYDYLRRDKDGNLRELHVEKAMKVLKAEPYTYEDFSAEENVIGKCKYFTTKEYTLADSGIELTVTSASFLMLTSVCGSGAISYTESDGSIVKVALALGETCFIPAQEKPLSISVSGDMTLITVEV